jgi:hypothetical protein
MSKTGEATLSKEDFVDQLHELRDKVTELKQERLSEAEALL